MDGNIWTLRDKGIAATIKADGAELCSLKNAAGFELLWQAGPAWPRHAPLLFPIVGRLNQDELRHDGRSWPMTQHGFARDLRFDWLARETRSCSLVLTDNGETRKRYPFAFRLVVSFAVASSDLDVTLDVTNTGEDMLPASIGAHPAFNWPLLPSLAKEDYEIVFANDEPAPVRRLRGGLMRAAPEPSPVHGDSLPLSARLFDDDAVIFDRLASTSVRYQAAHGPSIEIAWDGFQELGIWSKPEGAAFICIEPWRGFASPEAFSGDFTHKPGLMHIAPAETRRLAYRMAIRGT
ncbi:MAG: aldose 1-epimerase family protein [Bradyrhizobium sp.]|uniref:aldose 1-epimerase family protein n=1 Tax=Bradyrhizobium sp. TaxID=376 RepID=UPI001DD695E7|nr:aldose 1-epimerase family protein [Bradyrhizobium sp.]MBV9564845.1 aldose 1-epimerase family protein [Bradyrhizobium sp.]